MSAPTPAPTPGRAARPRVARRVGTARLGRWAVLLATLGAVALARAAPATVPPNADSPVQAERLAQLDALRATVAAQLQLQGAELLDELVYRWTVEPPFTAATPVVLADLTVPLGLGSGLETFLENHLAGLVIRHPVARVRLAHCPACTALVVHSGKEATVVSRGVDAPEALEKAQALSGARHALFVDFEAEGTALVLRARLVGLEPALPIISAVALSTTASSGALLRSGEQLTSAAEARRSYLAALESRGPFLVPLRFAVRSYQPAPADSGGAGAGGVLASVPFLWLQIGLEVALNQARAWTASVSAGGTFMPELHAGWMFQGRVARLLSGQSSSLTAPDLYGFFGVSAIGIQGLSALAFQSETPNIDTVLSQVLGNQARTLFAGFQVGLELRVRSRIAIGAFLESSPALDSAPGIGSFVDLGIIKAHAIGAEVSFCF